MKLALALLVGWLIVPLGSARAANLILIENGQSRAEIIIAVSAPPTVRLAAHDLRGYLQKISGARLPIATQPSRDVPVQIYVGRSEHTDRLKISAADLKHGAYRIVSGEQWLALIGDDTQFTPIEPWARNNGGIVSGKLQQDWEAITGAMWGVPNAGMYKHRLKLPGDTGLPNSSTANGKLPPLELWGLDERGSYNAVCGFLMRLGVRWYLPGELGEVVPSLKTVALPKIDETVRSDFEIRRFNVRFSTVPPDSALWAMRLGTRDPFGLQVAHGMATMTGRDEIFAAHPDWFALYGGKRKYQPGYSKNQLCYSNEELFKETVLYARAQLDHYDYEGVSIMPPDGYTAICQCPLCEGKDDPERGSRGALSNHIWDFVNRVAKEVGKTHPDKLIVCCAYGIYTAPPTTIEKLQPNVQVVIVGGRRPTANRPEQQAEIRQLREDWLVKTDRPLMVFENYPITDRGWYLPAYVAHSIGESIGDTKGKSMGEDIWLSFGPSFEKDALGFNHFQVYFTARMYWGGKQQNIDALLEEYCRLFYGPAASEARAFFDYCEANWQDMEKDRTKVDQALALFAQAQAKADSGSVYAQRLALIDDFLKGLRRKSAQLAQKRGVVPKLRMVGAAKDIVIDGKLDDAYWQNCPIAATGRLRELQTGRPPVYGTTVKAGWIGDSVYFAIRCEERPGEKLNIAATKKEDAALWYGDAVEILLATDAHSYYQIAVNPAGALVDYDRGAEKSAWSGWESQAEVATQVAEDHWTVEIRIPVTADENDPLNQLVGRRPTQSLPWHINICRQRIRDNDAELSAFSPTGTNGFHEVMKFAHFYDGRSHQFEADPTVTNYLTANRAATELLTTKKTAEALQAFIALAEGKVTPLQKSIALKQAAAAARNLKEYQQADELAARIPIKSEQQITQMHNLLAQRKPAEVIQRIGQQDLATWPFTSAGEAYLIRARAHAATGDSARARSDYHSALPLTSDKRVRADIERVLEK